MDSLSNTNYWKGYGLENLYNHRANIISSGKVVYMRSFMDFGSPFTHDGEEFKDITDRYKEQRAIVTKFQEKVLKYVEDNNKYSSVETDMFSEDLANK